MRERNRIGDRLKLARESKDLTQSEVARLLAYDRTTIAKWEGNVHSPPVESLADFSRIYDVNIAYFFEP